MRKVVGFRSIFFCAYFALIGNNVWAQQQPMPQPSVQKSVSGTPQLVQADEIGDLNVPDDAFLPDPKKAAFYAAILPGAGQAYNRALWKIPLVYAGATVSAYAVNFYNIRYSESLRSLRQIQYNSSVTEINGRNEAYYNSSTQFYRRQRDYSIILGGLYYGMTIVEAYVDAHLQSFKFTEEEFSLNVRPGILLAGNQPGIGITIKLKVY